MPLLVSLTTKIPNPTSKDEPIERDIQVGLSDGKKVEILAGVEEGDTVLLASLTSFTKDDKAINPFSPNGNTRPQQRGH